ncbi:MAG: hypothetical protein H6542_01565 [Lentimicrobiaceae bacterium]|nr:hypothetical protein [Lentimicrobiaceae bacterium]
MKLKELKAFANQLSLFEEFGKSKPYEAQMPEEFKDFASLIAGYTAYNPWFVEDHIWYALGHLKHSIYHLSDFLGYDGSDCKNKNIVFLIDPEAPLEGIGEMIYSALSGHNCWLSMPESDIPLYKSVIKLIDLTMPGFAGKFKFQDGLIRDFDAAIGFNQRLNPTVEKYFSKQPFLKIVSKGRSAVITGSEDSETLSAIAEGICMYFGRSGFSIKHLFIPAGYNLEALIGKTEPFKKNGFHNRYYNHYEYRKSGMLINLIEHLDNGFLLFSNDKSQLGFIGVVHCTVYHDFKTDVLESEIIKSYPLLKMSANLMDGFPIYKSLKATEDLFVNMEVLHKFFKSI